jgi:hypothetical protein
VATTATPYVEPATRHANEVPRLVERKQSSRWFLLALPIALLASIGSVVSLVLEDTIYGRETANWAAQSVGQDIANLIAFPVLLCAAYFAARGSMRAYVVWIGLLIYSAYTYAIYTFAVHFGPLFLVWVAVFGLSAYALIGALANIDAEMIKRSLAGRSGERSASRLLIGIGSVFALLWLSEIIPATLTGDTPDALKDVGLPTNPVHVLDLALLLPSLMIAGRLLAKGRPLGYVLAPALLVATLFLAVGIVSLMIVSGVRGLESSPVIGVAVAMLALVEALTAFRLLRHLPGSEA